MLKRLVAPWRHWRDADKNLYLVIDIPDKEAGVVVLMKVISYKDEDEVETQRIPYSDWVTLTEDEKLLTKVVPRLV